MRALAAEKSVGCCLVSPKMLFSFPLPRPPQHPASWNNLANAYRTAGRTAEIPLSEWTLADFEQLQGVDHPGTKAFREAIAAFDLDQPRNTSGK
jgi:hypothetical protein